MQSMNGFPRPQHLQSTPTYTPSGLQQPIRAALRSSHRAIKSLTARLSINQTQKKRKQTAALAWTRLQTHPKMKTSLPLVLLLVALSQAVAFPPPASAGQAKRASWDDVNVMAHGLLQLGQGLKEHVDKTKAQMREVDGKLRAFNGTVAELERRQREQGESLAARLKELEERERSLEELAQEVRDRVEEAKGRSEGFLARMEKAEEKVEGNDSDHSGVPFLQVRREIAVLATHDG